MKYSTPELVVLGTASDIVLGGVPGCDDNANPDYELPMSGLALGLDE